MNLSLEIFSSGRHGGAITTYHRDAVEVIDGLSTRFDLASLMQINQFNEILFDKIYPLMNDGGIILVDNVLWYGNVITDPAEPKRPGLSWRSMKRLDKTKD